MATEAKEALGMVVTQGVFDVLLTRSSAEGSSREIVALPKSWLSRLFASRGTQAQTAADFPEICFIPSRSASRDALAASEKFRLEIEELQATLRRLHSSYPDAVDQSQLEELFMIARYGLCGPSGSLHEAEIQLIAFKNRLGWTGGRAIKMMELVSLYRASICPIIVLCAIYLACNSSRLDIGLLGFSKETTQALSNWIPLAIGVLVGAIISFTGRFSGGTLEELVDDVARRPPAWIRVVSALIVSLIAGSLASTNLLQVTINGTTISKLTSVASFAFIYGVIFGYSERLIFKYLDGDVGGLGFQKAEGAAKRKSLT